MAVGDVLRRLTSKCIAYDVSGRVAERLRPLQFGVGVRGGCEAVVHATRATLASETIPPDEKWTLQVDLENGFNQSGREDMFKEVRKHLPDLGPWVESCYGQSSILNFGDGSVISTTGVHQGDPLGPLLFSLTLQPVLEKVQEVEGLVQNSWYLDDGMLVGRKEALVKAWDLLVAEGAPRGFHLSKEKSLVSCQGHNREDRDPLGRGVTRVEGGGFKLLGAPVGNWDYEEQILEERLVSVQHILDSLHLLDDPHMEYTLLRSCFSFPKFAFTLHTLDTSSHKQKLVEFDLAVKGALEAILGSTLRPSQWSQASLPVSLGGMGLRQAADHGAAAYLASLGASELLVQEMRRNQAPQTPEVGQAMQDLNGKLEDPLSEESPD